jgi:proteic killer suppression protein
VIKSFRHAGIGQFFRTGSKAGIIPAHAAKLANRLQLLDFAKSHVDMNMPGWALHKLTGDLKGHWAVKISGNWRLTFTFDKEDAILVDYQDYH